MTARIALALLFIVSAGMAYPWPSVRDRWVLGIAVAAVVILFAWWRGAFLTTIVARRVGVWRRNHGRRRPAPDTRTTAVLRVEPESDDQDPPLDVLACYLNRYGLRTDAVRVTTRDNGGLRTTWITLTLDATENLAALRARSADIPLEETAAIAIRRLRDHLTEFGFSTTVVDPGEVPALPKGKETWRGVRTDSGYLAAYRVAIDDSLGETLSAVRSQASGETWTTLELSGAAGRPSVAAACALHSPNRPANAPVPGLAAQRGRHGLALEALHPLSVQRLPV
ncbi:type VII secretion protein EccE [Mycobacterium sp. 1274761.0]|uniref:type VII secretion protein EccE n=1 Tax=Mycobacterium sp. 1274761.0 TaxID=1834077 RepID=UPI000800AC40|nr:type VII secretion protein EccE [Mycobacterium sp. 1274761.0]OBK71956.1 type VII secretion protein EccE [Mycobacterium sp. 1274761.0]